MRMLERIGRLEHGYEQRVRGARAFAEIMSRRVEQSEEDRRMDQLYRMIDSNPPVVMPMLGRVLELADKGAALQKDAAFLSEAECEEGRRLAAELTGYMQAGHAAVNMLGEAPKIRFGFVPRAVVDEPLCASGNEPTR